MSGSYYGGPRGYEGDSISNVRIDKIDGQQYLIVTKKNNTNLTTSDESFLFRTVDKLTLSDDGKVTVDYTAKKSTSDPEGLTQQIGEITWFKDAYITEDEHKLILVTNTNQEIEAGVMFGSANASMSAIETDPTLSNLPPEQLLNNPAMKGAIIVYNSTYFCYDYAHGEYVSLGNLGNVTITNINGKTFDENGALTLKYEDIDRVDSQYKVIDHINASNPHAITPDKIGAVPAAKNGNAYTVSVPLGTNQYGTEAQLPTNPIVGQIFYVLQED